MKKIVLPILIFCLCFPLGAFSEQNEKSGEEFLKGVWVSSVANLDYPSKSGLSAEELKAEADEIIAVCLETGMNAIFLQVRPCADALYNSSIFPKSTFLAEKSSYDKLEFDPLEYFTRRAHENNIQLHAWINPYRVTRLGEKEYLAFDPQSPQRVHPEYLLKTDDGNYFFNPALEEVRSLITDGVMEIIENYDVDGIHFDDYFYPEGSYDDSEQFAASGQTNVEEWRIENVNALVKQISEAIRAYDSSLSFGISPRGVWANDYENARGSATRGGGSLNTIYCDSLRFIEEGWVDYICPQIYWNIGYSAADYAVLVPWWVNAVKGNGVKLYIGMADYRIPTASSDSPWYTTAELSRQIALNRSYGEISGEVHFRYKTIADNPQIRSFYKEAYGEKTQAPAQTAAETVKENILMLFFKVILGG